MHNVSKYKIPSGGPARELLRGKGQFWTPEWVAEAMVAYVIAGGSGRLFDPAVGAGAFFRAAKVLADERGIKLEMTGMEIDPAALAQARESGLSQADLAGVRVGDFIFEPPEHPLSSIVANPPYIRHHRLSPAVKERLRNFGVRLTGNVFDGRAGLHLYFLIRALSLLGPGGRLAFIVPADTCEGVFAPTLWRWVAERFCLEAVVTFAPEASPFPNVDTNPLILMMRNAEPQEGFYWVRCQQAGTDQLKEWVRSGFTLTPREALVITRRQLKEGIATGLSRPPIESASDGPTLGDFASVLRGVATGANDFFFLTNAQAASLKIPDAYLVPAIGRTRDVPGDEITPDLLAALAAAGRPTRLLSLSQGPVEAYPTSLRQYLRRGEELGLPDRPLISQRRPWYKMEARRIPPILFAYLGRRHARFIRNRAGVIPLTCFLCVYPAQNSQEYLDRLWQVVSHPETLANLPLIGKSYGSGAVKVEPRALEKLPLPERLVRDAGLQPVERLF